MYKYVRLSPGAVIMFVGNEEKGRRLDATINEIRMTILKKGQGSIPRLLSAFITASSGAGVQAKKGSEGATDTLIIEISNIANQGARSPEELQIVYAATVQILAQLRLAKVLSEQGLLVA